MCSSDLCQMCSGDNDNHGTVYGSTNEQKTNLFPVRVHENFLVTPNDSKFWSVNSNRVSSFTATPARLEIWTGVGPAQIVNGGWDSIDPVNSSGVFSSTGSTAQVDLNAALGPGTSWHGVASGNQALERPLMQSKLGTDSMGGAFDNRSGIGNSLESGLFWDRAFSLNRYLAEAPLSDYSGPRTSYQVDSRGIRTRLGPRRVRLRPAQ